jgi:hypothetical protein
VKPPKLLRGGRPTLCLDLLRACAATGITSKFIPGKGGTNTRFGQKSFMGYDRLIRAKLVEIKRTGPRGGNRYHATELGHIVVELTTDFNETKRAQLLLLNVHV